MKIKYFTEEAYSELFTRIQENVSKYTSDNSWIKDYFNPRLFAKESFIDFNPPSLEVGQDFPERINVYNLYNALKDKLNPKQAAQPRLWAYLSHVYYWNYSVKRWSQEENSVRKIKERFFCGEETGSHRGLLRNSISRLWWFGYLTYQDEEKNHYKLTDILLSNSDLCQQIIERNFSMNKKIVSGILLAIQEFDNKNKKVVREEWRSLCKYINRYGAICILDSLSQDEIKNICINYICKMRNNKKVK